MIYIVFCVYILIALLQIPSLIKQKYWRELTVFSIFLSLAFVFSLLLILGVEIPSPLRMIQHGVQDRFNLHY